MTNLRHSPALPGDSRRPVYEISLDAATLAREYFLAEVIARICVGDALHAATYARHLVRLSRRAPKLV
jgi:hypothetical protein